MKQSIIPEKSIFHAGDVVTFRLDGLPSIPGKAVVRTNLGRAELHRSEIIQHTRNNKPILNLDWHDVELEYMYSLTTQTSSMKMQASRELQIPISIMQFSLLQTFTWLTT